MELLNIKPIKINKRIRKNGFEEAFFVIIVLLAIALFILVLAKVWNDVQDPLDTGLNSALPSDSSVNVTTILDNVGGTIYLFDKMLPFLIIGLFAFVLIGAGAYMQHPIMLFVGIIILGVAILLAAIYANVYQSISTSTSFTDTNANLPIQNKFMEYLPIVIILIIIGVTAAVIFAKSPGGGGL